MKNFPESIACVAGVQRGGRGEVECEREARSLGARQGTPAMTLLYSSFRPVSRIQLPPSLPFVRRLRRPPKGRQGVREGGRGRIKKFQFVHHLMNLYITVLYTVFLGNSF